MVVNTVVISYLLQILLRSSLSPDTYGTRMVYLGDSFGSPSLLGLTADLIMCRISVCSKDICQILLFPLNMLCGCYSPGMMEQAGCHSQLLSTSFFFSFVGFEGKYVGIILTCNMLRM